MNKRGILQAIFGRQIETTLHSRKLQPAREAAIRFAAELLKLDPSPTGDGLKGETVAALDKIFESLAWATRGVVNYEDASDREEERREIFEALTKLTDEDGDAVLTARHQRTLGDLLGLEIDWSEFDDEEVDEESKTGESEAGRAPNGA